MAVFLLLAMGLADAAWGHIDGRVFPIVELSDAQIAAIDLDDGDLADWPARGPALGPEDFFTHADVGEGKGYDPEDLDYNIWMGWHRKSGRLYFAAERLDDVYVNEYGGGDLGSLWRYDGLEVMVDGDHSGGDYTARDCWSVAPGESALEARRKAACWSDIDPQLTNNSSAQQYVTIADSPDRRHIGYLGQGNGWVTLPPYADGGGGTWEGPVTRTVLEFYLTPFDRVVYDQPEASDPSPLYPGKVIGLQISVPDFDQAPGEYRSYHTLSGQNATWRFAERFVDGRLVTAATTTAVDDRSWGRIKAAFGAK